MECFEMQGLERRITVTLCDALYLELLEAARECSDGESVLTPEMFAQQSVESVLASRRLKRIGPHE